MYNYLKTNAIKMTIGHMPNISFYCQRANTPTLSIQPAIQPTPFIEIPHGGDKIEKSDLQASFIVDENMVNYLEVFNWLRSYGFPENYDDITHLKTIRDLVSQNFEDLLKVDVNITILNSDNNPNISIDYFDCVPYSLTGIDFDIRQQEIQYPTSTVSFAYRDLKINKLK